MVICVFAAGEICARAGFVQVAEGARIFDEVTTRLREIFARDHLVVTPATTAADVSGWDSMKQIEIVIAAEEKYGIRMKARDVDAMRTVGDLISLINEKTS